MILGIESSCDETAAAVVTADGYVRSSVIHSQIPVHAQYGGVVPELASRNHLTAIDGIVRAALSQAGGQAGVTMDDLTAVAVTQGPGLAGCLLVGVQVAKAIAWSRGLPLVPVDHIQAHVHAPFLRDDQGGGANPPEFPYIALAVSGGHTSLCRVDAPGRVHVLAQTLDDAAGEAFDKVAKMMGLPYPGGVHIDRIARSGRADAFNLPRPMLHRGLDFSFSGLKTAARLVIEGRSHWDAAATADLAASVQQAIVDVLVKKTVKACQQTKVPRIVVAGGVAANSVLRASMQDAARRHRLSCHLTPARYCGDNAAMVAGLGAALLEAGGGLEGPERLSLDIYTTHRPPR